MPFAVLMGGVASDVQKLFGGYVVSRDTGWCRRDRFDRGAIVDLIHDDAVGMGIAPRD